jgi:hypothetical protein
MNLSFIEYEPQKVLEAFRRGEFDSLEVIGQADERDFFQRCFQERLLQRLADSLPSVRKKREVPQWFILAANLSLKLHQENSFLAFERVVRCGGLLAALPPELAEKHLDAKSREWALRCQGFNRKNSYDRATPCDQDTLRKALKDVAAATWLEWFNGAVQQVFQSYGFFDPEGLFIGDGSYLFVPDNPAYEGSAVLWFDEHNHPVKYEEITPEQRQHVHRERCYKWVSLLHLRGDAHVYAGAVVLPGNAHEVGPFFKLVEQFVRTVGKGVIKWLVLDRGFIDGEEISRCKQQWDIEVVIPMKKKMDIWADAWALAQKEPWQSLAPEPAPVVSIPACRPERLRRSEAKRQKTLAERKAAQPLPPSQERYSHTDYCCIKGFTSWTAATVPIAVVCLRDHYADGHHDDWGLMSTSPVAQPLHLLGLYRKRTAIEERHRQLKCFYDLTDFRSRSFNAIAAQLVMVLLTYTLRQWQLWKFLEENLAGLTPEGLAARLRLLHQWIVIYLDRAYTQLPVVTFTREAIQLEGMARQKALRKLELLENFLLTPIPNPRPPRPM